MKKKNNKMVLPKILFVFITVSIFVIGCEPDITKSLADRISDKGIPAEIISVSPESGYSGVTTITITGKNFSPVLEENTVHFGSGIAKLISGTTTELVVKAPIALGDSLLLQIGKKGVAKFNDPYYYKLSSAVTEYYTFLTNQEPYVATLDNDENIYFSFIEATFGVGVYQISNTGVLSQYALRGTETTYNDLKYYSEGYLFGVLSNRAIYKIEAGVKPAVFINTGITSINLTAFDFDKNKNIWAGGKGGKIVFGKMDKSFKLFDYAEKITAVRVFNDYLYAISGEVNNQNIVRFPFIGADSIGTVETYFPFSANVEFGDIANAITFAADGQMYIATSPRLADYTDIENPIPLDPIDPIMYVNTDGSFGTWYPGLINSGVSSFTWGNGTELFVVRDKYPSITPTIGQSILKIDMERLGAPDYGRN